MPFSPKTRETVLVSCSRSCCLCHRFRGTKIEVHHIVPLASGGTNDISNAIPVCFDCHADIEHYNINHPKGTKYSENELKSHRDLWFEKVSKTYSRTLSETPSDIDIRIALEIHGHMEKHGSYNFLRDGSFWTGCDYNTTFNEITELDAKFLLPDMQFLDSDLEESRAIFATDLKQAVSLMGQTGELCFGNYRAKPMRDISDEAYTRMSFMSSQCDDANSEAAKSYDSLVDLFRRTLKLDIRF
jgi:hypothetical protein